VLVEKEDTATAINTSIQILKCLEDIKVKRYIQKDSKIYLIGYEGDKRIPLYAIANIEEDILEKVYYLYSDIGDVEINTISIDYDELRIYVGGYIKEDDASEDKNPPIFLETFSYI